MEQWEQLGQAVIAGNETWRWLTVFFLLLAAFGAGRILRAFLRRSAERFTTHDRAFTGEILSALSRPVTFIAFIVGLRMSLAALVLPEGFKPLAELVVAILIVLAIGFVAYRMVEVICYWLAEKARKTNSKMDTMLVPLVRSSLRVTVVIMVVLQVATMLSDKPLTSILAGLGVGGLAIALAAQDTVKNLFGSLVILMDKPFEVGDRLILDGHDGTVEVVGFRSTRLRRLDGQLVAIPNGELANKTIQNVSRRPFIPQTINLSLRYDTSPEKMKEAVAIVKAILENHEGMKANYPPRVYFNAFQEWALNLYAIYWYHPADWWTFCAFNETVHFEILKRFNEADIEFALPSRSVYMASAVDGGSPVMPA